MKRRFIAAVAALLLGGIGALLLVNYVGGADQRALAGTRTVNVLVATKPIAAGIPAEQLAKLVNIKAVPALAVIKGTLSSLDQVRGQVATTPLQAGEQLLSSRFADPKTLEKANEVKIPKGMQQVSVLLESKRVLGGSLTPGATVGLFISTPKEDRRPAQTHLALHKVLVSRVEGGNAPAAPQQEDKPASPAPPGEGVMVTLVTSAADAGRVVFAAEYGAIWLSLEPSDAVPGSTRVVTAENVNK